MVTMRNRKRGLAVYLDVSGSVNQHLPSILAVLARLEGVLTSVLLFSTEVKEVPMRDVMRGKLVTTYGTSFDCVARSLIERQYQRAVLLTDGYATLSAHHTKHLTEANVRLLTVLFGNAKSCPALAPLGEVVQLTDVAA